MLFGDKNSAAHVTQHQKRKDIEKKMIEKVLNNRTVTVSKNVISNSSDIPEPLFQNVDDDNFIFDESKTVSNTSTSKPDPEIREQPEMIFDDFPDNSIPEVVSIDDNYSDGNTGCRVFKGGIENSIDFLPKINIVRGNNCIL